MTEQYLNLGTGWEGDDFSFYQNDNSYEELGMIFPSDIPYDQMTFTFFEECEIDSPELRSQPPTRPTPTTPIGDSIWILLFLSCLYSVFVLKWRKERRTRKG